MIGRTERAENYVPCFQALIEEAINAALQWQTAVGLSRMQPIFAVGKRSFDVVHSTDVGDRTAAAANDHAAYAQADFEFHNRLMAISANKLFIDMHAQAYQYGWQPSRSGTL